MIWVDDMCLALKIIRQPGRGSRPQPSLPSPSSTWPITTPFRYVHTHPHPPLAHTTPQRPCTKHCLRSPPTCPRRFSHRSHSFCSSQHSCSHSTFQRLFTHIRFRYSGNSCVVLTVFQKTVSLFGKEQSRHSRASSAVSVWLPFSVA